MAKIMNVDYEAIPGRAKEIRQQGQELNNEMTTAYASISGMHTNWYGQRYNALVKEFNNLIPQLNEMLDLVIGDIPFALETIANNYATADTGSGVTGAVKTAPNKITDLAMSTEVGMKFLTNEVTTVKNNVSQNFKNAREKMNVIESVYSKIQWESEAADAFRAKFTKLKNSIVQSFENIESQFSVLMQQTLDDIQATENANTVQ